MPDCPTLSGLLREGRGSFPGCAARPWAVLSNRFAVKNEASCARRVPRRPKVLKCSGQTEQLAKPSPGAGRSLKGPPGAFASATNTGRSAKVFCLPPGWGSRTGKRSVPSGCAAARPAELGPAESPGCCSGSPARSCCGSPPGSCSRGCSSCRPGSPGPGPWTAHR
jgi:hypothetical protein